jgi:soluble P-type ATPase
MARSCGFPHRYVTKTAAASRQSLQKSAITLVVVGMPIFEKSRCRGIITVINVTIPGRGTYRIEHLVLDLNGTISSDGGIIRGVSERLEGLKHQLDITVVTADTNKNAQSLLEHLPVSICTIGETEENEQKLAVVLKKGKHRTACVGNGANDVSMLRESTIGICVVGQEGASAEAMMASDVVVPTVNDALDLLLKPNRLQATLRR